jgi:hypothetical protein
MLGKDLLPILLERIIQLLLKAPLTMTPMIRPSGKLAPKRPLLLPLLLLRFHLLLTLFLLLKDEQILPQLSQS